MQTLREKTARLLELLGHTEEPFGVYYTDVMPEDGFAPKSGEIFSREREMAGAIDWNNMMRNFSCIIGNTWLARKKKKPAWLSLEQCGCMGGGYYSGMYAPYLEFNVAYVSHGVPGTPVEGEHYLQPESVRAFMEDVAPPKPPAPYCVIKPLSLFGEGETPLVIVFFARPEVLSGLFTLTCYAADDYQAVVSPFGAGCTNIIAWPLTYQARGEDKAVLGGFDASCRKFLKTDELTFAAPLGLYQKMLDSMEVSLLTKDTWQGVRKKVLRSEKAWEKS